MSAMKSRGILRSAALAVALLLPSTAMAAAEPRNMTQAEANAAVRQMPALFNPLFTAAVIRHVVRVCDALEGPSRMQRRAYFLPVYLDARRAGFSRAQIEAFVNDPQEQALMQAQVDRFLQSRGVAPAQPAAVCAFGRAEMAAGTAIGRRLSER